MLTMAVIQNFILSLFFMFQSGNLLSGKMSILVGLNGNVKLE